ncbi:MAG: riboflavin biosynthesis protein RibD, partial [Pseudomonadales bacterium]
MISESDLLYLRGTVELAEQGLFSCAPNPRVGCIIVRDGRVLGRGAHLRTGGSHAEVVALADAGGDAA